MSSQQTIILKKLFPLYLLVIVLTIATMYNSFFWDKDILISKQAYWFLENKFRLNLPNNFDISYPPVLSFLLAILWKILGKNIVVGHLLMLPFSIGIITQLYFLLKKYFKSNKYISPAILLIILDVTLLSQMAVVSSDLILVFFFLASVNSIHKNKKWSLAFYLIGLGLIHFRGAITIFGLFLYDLFLNTRNTPVKNYPRLIINSIPPYIPITVLLSAYFIYHYLTAGWAFKHDASPWAGCFETVDFKGFIRNIFIVGWRLVDFGRIFLWLAGFYFFLLFIRKKIQFDNNLRNLFILCALILAVNLPGMLIYKVLSAHRYLLPVFILISLIISYILFEKLQNNKIKKGIYIILLIGLITGNLWVYPDKIAQGWDSTLGSLPYFSLRKKMIEYIEKNNITFKSVGSDTPMASKFKYIDLTEDNRIFEEKDFTKDEYILYTNIINEFTDEEIDKLNNEWVLEKEFRFFPVHMRLYKNPRFTK